MPKFAFIGDSLTQGFQSGAIARTRWSYPAMIVNAFGVPPSHFQVPDFSGEGGLPANLERVIRGLDGFGTKLDLWEVPEALAVGYRILNEVEAYWERGEGARASNTGPIHHNLAVWGFSVSDAYMVTEGMCRRKIEGLRQTLDFDPTPSQAMYRTARRTLNPQFAPQYDDVTQLDAVELIGGEEPVENLIYWLGANNVLGTTFSLELKWSASADVHKLPHQRECNIWTIEHFELLWKETEARLKALQKTGKVERIFVGTVPDVTIPPITRGVSPSAMRVRNRLKKENPGMLPQAFEELCAQTPGTNDRSADGLFEYYTHFWIWDQDFARKPDEYPHITRDEARQIQRAVRGYNDTIRASAERNGWHVVDIAELLRGLAFRRSGGNPTALPVGLIDALTKNPATASLTANGSPPVDTRFFGSIQTNGVEEPRGGIFALDGVHPTTVGYGIVADTFLSTMQAAGVPGADTAALNWDAIVEADTLLTNRPALLGDLESLVGRLDPLFRKVFAAMRDMSGRG